MRKKVLSLLLVLTMLCALMPIIAYAASNGTCGTNLTWTLDDGTLTISGTGEMNDHTFSKYKDNIKTVIIENGVTSIDRSAFYEYSNLTSITIPSSVTKIGIHAFVNCSNLESVYITDLAAWLNIDYSQGEDRSNPMNYANKLYLNNQRIISLDIPEGITKIPNYAFSGCDSIKSVTIPSSVTSIGEYAFFGCSGLTNVTIPAGVTSIEGHVFYGCSSLTGVTIPDSVTSIGGYAFYGCSSLTSVTIPDSVTNIWDRAFSRCSGLTSVTMGESVTYIGDDAFSNCDNLTDVTIPDGVTNIGSVAFYGCKLTELTIPEAVTNMGDSICRDCENLTTVNYNAIDCNISTKYNYDGCFKECFRLTKVNIGEKVTKIPDTIFMNCENLTSITMPDSVTTVGEKAFENCSHLMLAKLGNSVSCINSNAFSGCVSLKKVFIPKSMTEIEKGAFLKCSRLTTVEYGGSREDWEKLYIGVDNENLTNANINYNSSGADMTLTDLDYLSYVKNENGTITITDCDTAAVIINIPSKIEDMPVTGIGYEAFARCGILAEVTIPDSVTSIVNRAFSGCSDLKNIYYTSTKEQWEAIYIGENGNDSLKNATIHYNSTDPAPTPITTADINRTDTAADTSYTFDVAAAQKYDNCYVYAAVYDENGALLAVESAPLEMTGNTVISVSKSKNDKTAQVFVWSDTMQPIIVAEEFGL